MPDSSGSSARAPPDSVDRVKRRALQAEIARIFNDSSDEATAVVGGLDAERRTEVEALAQRIADAVATRRAARI